MTLESEARTRAWLENLNRIYGIDGVVHEVDKALSEMQGESDRRRRYSAAVYEAYNQLEQLYLQTGLDEVLAMHLKLKKLHHDVDAEQTFVQLEMQFVEPKS